MISNVVFGINIVLLFAAPILFLDATAGLSKLLFAFMFFVAFANIYFYYLDMKSRGSFVMHEDTRREEDRK